MVTILNDSQRAAYLDAMGITVFLSRFNELGEPLLHPKIIMAPRIGDSAILPAIQIQPVIETIEDQPPVVTSNQAVLEATIAPSDEVVEESNTSTQLDDDVITESVEDPEIRFSVMVHYHTSGVAILDVCDHQLGHQRAHNDLCVAIIQALCHEPSTESNQFSWPVVNMPRMDRRLSKARVSTKAFLNAFTQRCPVSLMIVMGDRSDVITTENIQQVNIDFSLSDILTGSVSKSVAWQALRKYRQK